jgi:hypothetical protein
MFSRREATSFHRRLIGGVVKQEKRSGSFARIVSQSYNATVVSRLLPSSFPLLLCLCAAARGQCPGGWQPGFGGTSPDDVVFATQAFDDGTGPRLYASGKFGGLGGGARVVAVLNAGIWSQVGANADVRAFAVWDDGTGPALYAAGDWPVGTTHDYGVRRLLGGTWVVIGSALPAMPTSLKVFDHDGPGPGAATLYVAGTTLGARALSGASWVTIGAGDVRALCVYDADGAGPGLGVLVAGGSWASMGAATSWSVAAWNGASWASLGTGIIVPPQSFPPMPFPGTVTALGVYNAGGGPALYVGGTFSQAGSVLAQNLAVWTPSGGWSSIGGIVPPSSPSVPVASFEVFDAGSGPRLYVGGNFTSAGGVQAYNLARYGPGGWSAPGGGVSVTSYSNSPINQPTVYSLGTFDSDGVGPAAPVLIAGGAFQVAGTVSADCLASWNGTSWAPLVVPTSLSGAVYSAAVFDDGSGPALYVGGSFVVAGPVIANRIARYDGTSWTPLGPGMNGTVYSLIVQDDGTGPQLYAGGSFTAAPGQPGNGVARWNGASWSAVGGGVTGGNAPAVCALAVHDDGTGPKLFAGGAFTTAGAIAASGIARWDGASWSPLGSGVPPLATTLANFPPGWILTLKSFDPDGAGPLPSRLYAGGRFDSIDGVAALNVASWNGAFWSPLGPGLGYPTFFVNGTVASLAVSNVEGPAKLFACGLFKNSGAVSALNGIARWNGAAWSPLGTGFQPQGFGSTEIALTMTTWNDGGGESLYVGGQIGSAGSVQTPGLARWNGSAWSEVGGGLSGVALCFAELPPSIGLVVGGGFSAAGGVPSVNLARWLPGHPGIAIVQPGGPGTGVFVNDANLQPPLEYYNLFSTQPCGVVGSGPYFGLCATDVFTLLNQFLLPVGSLPFHFPATASSATFGPFLLPPGMTVDGISLTVSGGGFCTSPVSRLTVQ